MASNPGGSQHAGNVANHVHPQQHPGNVAHQGTIYPVPIPAQRQATYEAPTTAAERQAAEGPTEPLRASEKRASKRRRFGVVLAVLLSLLALLAAAGAAMLSWRALEMARHVPRAAPPTATDDGAASRPPEPEEYPVTYAKEPLRVQVGCSAVLFLDLDEPRADAAEQVADLRYDSRCGDETPRMSLGAGAAAGSEGVGSDIDAAGCLRAIRTSPLGPGAEVEVKKGTALCVLTAATPAELVLVEILDVGGTGTAGLRATSWRVPR